MPISELEARVRALEDLEQIRALKSRYLFSCDSKNPQAIRDCFVPGEVFIDYGAIGVFRHRDELVELFTRLACHEHIVEMHHGVNPRIVVTDEHRAHGTWSLFYQQINTVDNRLTQLGAYYEDEYQKIDGEWMISKTRCVVTSTLVRDFAQDSKIVFAGRSIPQQIMSQEQS
ncbi:nuclear transport factor 2 family protein [Herbaspirillum sp. GCM10030257]|uniref:nuclear transport factor 2 family protein n=1 Tax=Herbaspirillum sp. GCM10030257 TaxID=3273393 RepID=UPI00361DF958